MLFYRIVRTNPPTLSDFTSNAAKGLPPPRDAPETVRLWGGISVFVTEAQARHKAHQYPSLGRYIAVLDVPADGPIRWERTLPRSRGHHTLWGEARVIGRCALSVVPA
jgi:hypothetical protein